MVVAATCALLLAGCTIEPYLEPFELTYAEVSAIIETRNNHLWEDSFPGGTVPKPEAELVRFVAPEDWSRIIEECMGQAGLELEFPDDPSYRDAYYSRYYVCIVRFPIGDSSYYLSSIQLGLLYDYYAARTVPCLKLMGIRVLDQPTREHFIEAAQNRAFWSPYRSLQIQDEQPDWDYIDWRCPPLAGSAYPASH